MVEFIIHLRNFNLVFVFTMEMSTLYIAGIKFYVWYYPKTYDFTLCWPLH